MCRVAHHRLWIICKVLSDRLFSIVWFTVAFQTTARTDKYLFGHNRCQREKSTNFNTENSHNRDSWKLQNVFTLELRLNEIENKLKITLNANYFAVSIIGYVFRTVFFPRLFVCV